MKLTTPVILVSLIAVGLLVLLTQLGASRVVTVSIPRGSSIPDIGNFTPEAIRVVIGLNNTVLWRNNDDFMHTVTSTSELFDSGEMNPRDTFRYTFGKQGIYHYYCIPHPWMKATVTVTERNNQD